MSQVPNSYPYWLGTAPTSATASINGVPVNLVPVVVKSAATTQTVAANTYYNVVTTTDTLAAGTYLVGADFFTTATNGNAYIGTDTLNFIVADSNAGGGPTVTTYPNLVIRPFYSVLGSTSTAWEGTVSGILVLTAAAKVSYQIQTIVGSFTGKTVGVEGCWYQRIA